ncbi:holo-[acyl-carrier-protein] synthase [Fusobacterium vincentii 3_1_36A2]|uniref:Holo-[acyl-carrier-protein] synthase n=1 Tax=Fusobacterium vincentii 3_1_36A2 TaxID=469604 RepID=C7XSX0_FUSVC|nr:MULTISPECIES: holo-ACP synthase [Fusobacterium]EEU31326.1 holo-[acyl-carrier-protein] synthase [Fusobacterium vincentii 3_1_36A2]EMP16390.1 holo-ACP synthase [Fusobacterium nucleatum CC53]
MIVGIGNDIIEIERIEKAISKESFKNKVYTQRELENIEKRGDRVETYAGIFSAKEAISKAIGTGVREFSLTDLEILNDDLGKPYVVVSEKLDKIIKSKKEDYQIEISISHSKKYATAVAIIL